MPELISAIEDAFAAYESGDAQMPPKSYIDLPQYNGDFRSMPAYLDAATGTPRASSGSTSTPTTPTSSTCRP